MARTYGGMAKKRRLELGWSLRRAAKEMGMYSGNLSNVERGLWKPPKSPNVILRVSQALGWVKGSREWIELTLLAATERGELPGWVREDELMMAKVARLVLNEKLKER